MRMPDNLSQQLHTRYGCPVIDIIALNEVGLLAVKIDAGHEVLPHDVYVEILGSQRSGHARRPTRRKLP